MNPSKPVALGGRISGAAKDFTAPPDAASLACETGGSAASGTGFEEGETSPAFASTGREEGDTDVGDVDAAMGLSVSGRDWIPFYGENSDGDARWYGCACLQKIWFRDVYREP